MFNRDNLLLECDTEFDHYQVVDLFYEGRRARVLFSGNRDAAFSGMPLDDNHDMLFDYIQRMFEFTSSLRPKKVLLIGGGTYTLPSALIQSLPDIQIDTVEIDPHLEVIAEEFFNLKPSPRLNLYHADGKDFLVNSYKKYDLILVDAFSHLEIPESLSDDNFAKLINQHLSDNGVLAMNIISSYKGNRSGVIKHFYNIYKNNFKHTNIYPASHDASLWMSQNFILVCEKSEPLADQYMRYKALDSPL